jgi:hypothetical protein
MMERRGPRGRENRVADSHRLLSVTDDQAAALRYPSFWNTVEEIKTNADGLLFWCFDEAAHLPDK